MPGKNDHQREENKTGISVEVSGNQGTGQAVGQVDPFVVPPAVPADLSNQSLGVTFTGRRGGGLGVQYDKTQVHSNAGPSGSMQFVGATFSSDNLPLVGEHWQKRPLVIAGAKGGLVMLSTETQPLKDIPSMKNDMPALMASFMVGLNDRKYIPGLKAEISGVAGIKNEDTHAEKLSLDLAVFKSINIKNAAEITLSAGVNSTYMSTQSVEKNQQGVVVSHSGVFGEGLSHGLNPTAKLSVKIPLGHNR